MASATMMRRTILCCSLLLAAAATARAQGEAEAHFSTGLTHLREGRVDMAIDEFKKATKKDSKNPYFQKGLGLAFARKGRYDDAIGALKKAIEINPYFSDVRNDLATVLMLAGRREEGKKEFLAAYGDAMNPFPEFSAQNLGQAYLEEKNWPEAANWFRTCIARNDSWSAPYLGLADALDGLGRGEEAIAQLENGLARVKNDASLSLALGGRYLKVGRFTDARTQFEAALQKDPGGPVGQSAAAALKDLPK
jgi:tetratricopeptide (TPR) repeat protein